MAVVCCGLHIVCALLILAEDSDAKVLDEILQVLSLHVFSMVMVAMVMSVIMRVARVTEDACKQENIMEIQTVLEFSHTHTKRARSKFKEMPVCSDFNARDKTKTWASFRQKAVR